MAGEFVAGLLKINLEQLVSQGVQRVGLAWGIQDDLKKLESTMSAINSVLQDAGDSEPESMALKDWLRKLKEVAYYAENVFDEIDYEDLRSQVEDQNNLTWKDKVARHFLHKPKLTYEISTKLKEIEERLDTICAEKSKLHLPERVQHKRKCIDIEERQPTHSFVNESRIVGRDDDREKIVDLLINKGNEEDVSVISIVGMGGLGKTTLAQLAYNDERVRAHFSLLMWVSVTDDFNLKRLAKETIESATGNICEASSLELMQRKLQETLKGRKFLLVLDDVWNEKKMKWQSLKDLIQAGERGSKVLATTRSENVASIMSTISTHPLTELSEDHCWCLFKQEAFRQEEEADPELVPLGKEIVKKCAGLPLAAKTIGSLMYFKKDVTEWLSVRDSEIWELPEDGDGVLHALRLSYNHLAPHLKRCFAYCSIFHKGERIDKYELIRHWMAAGFIRSSESDGGRLMEDIGDQYFNELLSRSFFQVRNNLWCKVHDLFIDLARSVAVVECSAFKWGKVKNVNEKAYYSSVEGTPEAMNKTKNLRALRVFDVYDIPPNFFSSLRYLRVLHLEVSCVSGPLEPIAELKLLRYLYIFQIISSRYPASLILSLPATICKLYHLQTLVLNRCTKLEVLHSDTGNLINLRHLDLTWTEIQELPATICKLYHLQTLVLSGCRKFEVLPCNIGDLLNLRHLDLSGTEIQALPATICKLYLLQTLVLCGCRKLEVLPWNIGDLINLRHLDLSGTDIQELPGSINNLCNLHTLNLLNCKNLGVLNIDFGNFRKLRHLYTDAWLTWMPRRLGQACLLQKLPRFVIEKESGCGLCELQGLNLLQGELCVEQLQNVERATDAIVANLKEKRLLHKLILRWKLPCTDNERENAKLVLEGLQPPSKLKELMIFCYPGVNFPSWMKDLFLPDLVEITLRDCTGCEHLPPLGGLRALKKLEIQGMDRVQYITEDFYDKDTEMSFPSLEHLTLEYMSNLVGWRGVNRREVFPRLKVLRISHCPRLKNMPGVPSLRILELTGLPVMPEGLQYLSSLESMHINRSECLSLTEKMEHLTSLQILTVSRCPHLDSLPESLQLLSRLKRLHITDCLRMRSLPLHSLTALETLETWGCPELEGRYDKRKGSDRHLIQHIPKVFTCYYEAS